MLLNLLMFYLLQIPGVPTKIPGMDYDYLPEQGAIVGAELHHRLYICGVILLAVTIPVAVGVALFAYGQKMTWRDLGIRLVLVMFLFLSQSFIFGTIMQISFTVGNRIVPREEAQQLNNKIREAATKAQQDKGVVTQGYSWYEKLFLAISNASSGVVSDLFIALAGILFSISSVLITYLFRVFVIVIYALGPIAAALSIIPGWGTRILLNWITKVLELSFWPIWMSICAFIWKSTDQILLSMPPNDGNYTPTNHMESAILALTFAILYLLTPIIAKSALLSAGSIADSGSRGILAGAIISKQLLMSNLAYFRGKGK